MDRFESELKMQELNNQRDIVNAIKDLVVVQGMMVKTNGLARLSSKEILKLDNIISRNMKCFESFHSLAIMHTFSLFAQMTRHELCMIASLKQPMKT